MLYHKLITLPISCIVQVRKLHNNVIHPLTRKSILYLSFMQLPQYRGNSSYLGTENDEINKIPLALSKYLSNIDPIFRKNVIQSYLSLKADNIDPYIINDNISNEFTTLIKDDLLENMCYVIELNPGYGLLTRRLLEAGVSFIHLYENHDEFYDKLQSLKAIFHNRIKITKANLLRIHKMLSLNRTLDRPNLHLCELFNNIPKRKWEEKGCMQKLTCHNNRSLTLYTIFNTLFDSTMFGTLDRQGFLPWQQIKKSKTRKLTCKDDSQLFYVVKLEPKSNLLSLFGGREQMIYFWHFVRHYFYRPSMKIIPTLEKIIPGFGIRLIEKDYNIFTQFNELSINEIIDLYMEFRSYPGFDESSFLSSANDIRRIYDPYVETE